MNYDELSQLEQLDIDTDLMAKQKMTSMVTLPHWDRCRPQQLPFEKVEIYWTNQQRIHIKVCSTLTKTLSNKIQSTATNRGYDK
jgi:hypothetical protein